MQQTTPESRDLLKPQEPNGSPEEYRIAIEGMSCQHCVDRVERAIRSVPGVMTVRVSLENNLAEVSGGKPHQVIEAVKAAGYDGRPLPQIPASCELPLPESRTKPVEAAPPRQIAGGYQLAIEDMTCASCVATVERAIRAVPGVTDAAVNLVEKRAQVSGGEPQTVVDAVIDQGNASIFVDGTRAIANWVVDGGTARYEPNARRSAIYDELFALYREMVTDLDRYSERLMHIEREAQEH